MVEAMTNEIPQVLIGKWSYRSFLPDPHLDTPFNELEFGKGTIEIESGAMQMLKGKIGGPGWSLALSGSIAYGNPFTVNFQGKGVVGGAEWIYNYLGYLAPLWANGVDQRPALVGTIVRTVPHPTGPNGQSTAPAGFVAQWIAVKQDAS